MAGLCLGIGCAALEADTRILIGKHASDLENLAARELKADIERVSPQEMVRIDTFQGKNSSAGNDKVILLGRRDSHDYLSDPSALADFPLLNETLEAETFVIQSDKSSRKRVAIMGADDRGVLYGAYEFSRQVLGIDAMEFWTGKKPARRATFSFPELAHRAPPPAFHYRGYFDNDNDMLANWKGRKLIVEFDIWKEMIDSLARLRFNYIDIHDLLGRPEYYLRDYYTRMTDYHTDLELVDKVIDYAHSKGMLVQIPMYLGWEFKHLTMDEVCVSTHFERWMEIYEYYLSETPLGKGDLFLARPRHPIYDWAYECPSETTRGIKAGPLLESVFSGLGKLIEKHSPGGILVSDLWQEGRAMWVNGEFSPGEDIQMLWADDGFADFGEWPDSLRGYQFGIYLHAGVWKNQVVQNPYPNRIDTALTEAAARGMTANCLVNGQSFKPFILNLEASARAMWSPSDFNGEAFLGEWTSRYFGQEASPLAVRSLELLQKAHDFTNGYRDVTKASQKILKNLHQDKAEAMELAPIRSALSLALESRNLARDAEGQLPENSLDVFDDQLLFPITIFVQNLELLKILAELNNAWLDHGHTAPGSANREQMLALAVAARAKLVVLRASLEQGSRWKKWETWTRPENFRIHTPPPELDDIDSLIDRL